LLRAALADGERAAIAHRSALVASLSSDASALDTAEAEQVSAAARTLVAELKAR
jgi:hypothetical protein